MGSDLTLAQYMLGIIGVFVYIVIIALLARFMRWVTRDRKENG
jgi:hypothetical protein